MSKQNKLISFVFQDYYDRVSKPMDLSTISTKLDSSHYKDPWDYIEDVWLMFDNAFYYNKKKTTVYNFAIKVGT